MSHGKPGRPNAMEPRVAELEQQLQATQHQLGNALMRLAALEAVRRDPATAPKTEYQPQFTSWAQTRGG